MKNLRNCMVALISIVLLSACGGAPQQQSTGGTIKAVIKTAGLTSNQNIAGVQLSVSVPLGVTPIFKADGATVDAAATVEISSTSPANQGLSGATFTPATATGSGQLVISAIEAAGFQANDLITIHLKIVPGAKPLESDFKLLSFEAYNTVDTSGTGSSKVFGWDVTNGANPANTINLTPTLTATIQ